MVYRDDGLVSTTVHASLRLYDPLDVGASERGTEGDPLALRESDSIVDAMAHLRQRGVRRAPVVAASGDLVGIVSTDDLLAIIAEQLGSLAGLVDRQTRGAGR